MEKYYIEEFSFCKIDYDFGKFDGVRETTSEEYGFKIEFWNDEDFRFKGNIAYKIYIPYKFLDNKLGVEYYIDYENILTENIKNFDIDYLHDIISDLRVSIEDEILRYLKYNNLLKSIQIYDENH